jgi:APA family basic amino acid/polyamine antiporter
MEANNKASSDAPIRFNRVLGRADLMAISMGLIIGAGIITLTGIAIRMTGRSVCIAFILAAGIIAITNIPFSYVAGTIRVEGGQYTQMALFAPKFVTGIYLYIYVFATIALSMYGISFANYFLQLVPGANLQLVAILSITAMFLLNFLGIKSVAKAQILMVVLTTLALTLFICFGINHVKPDYFEPKGFFRNGTIGLMTATALLTFAADGAKSIINFSPECKDPTRDIPFVMTVSTLAVGFLYAMIGVVASGVLPVEQVSGKTLAVVAYETMPYPVYIFFIIGGALFALLTTINATIGYMTKPLIQACEDGWLPKKWLYCTLASKHLTLFCSCSISSV